LKSTANNTGRRENSMDERKKLEVKLQSTSVVRLTKSEMRALLNTIYKEQYPTKHLGAAQTKIQNAERGMNP
jgi:hypothetical protein